MSRTLCLLVVDSVHRLVLLGEHRAVWTLLWVTMYTTRLFVHLALNVSVSVPARMAFTNHKDARSRRWLPTDVH